ncbi:MULTISPECIES: amino acid ABC transporter permease [Proteiniclasticum]|uniref:Amino acid ABC transporter membrane protein, PAAT family n=1 Tax=Proteiniclasticum ruminis TaxID=398199 RepID=A0A1I5A068_9CLOT|nr:MULTISPECIES: amino acid ABC transporter permease [Proteiniclasticum]SFN55787.1 amino acid ABC transporter membrane protein, PAAT family [Proteiniclasticum ruminis]HBW13602.1 amino acid ABC transporter permease [Proteiniclasticum sp.]
MLTQEQVLGIVEGTQRTLLIAGVSVLFGILLGIVIALFKISRSKALNGLAWFYVWIFRGTPMLMQLFVFYYALPLFTYDVFGVSLRIPALLAAFIAFSLNSAAYLSEIFRGAIQSIDKGQMEAAKALGMSYYQAMFKIIIPQSYRRLIPPLGNELITLVKDTSLVASISLFDLLRTVQVMNNSSGEWVYFIYAGVIYLFVTSIIQLVFDKLEKKYSVYE